MQSPCIKASVSADLDGAARAHPSAAPSRDSQMA